MYRKKLVLLFLFVTILYRLNAQVLPKEDNILNYRLIGFTIPPEVHIDSYRLEIAAGCYSSDDSFTRHIIKTISAPGNKVIAEVPYWGRQYTWRIVGEGADTKNRGWHKEDTVLNNGHGLHHFSTGFVPAVDPTLTRLRIISPAVSHKDDYVFIDGNRALYDMEGNPVWYFPKIGGRDYKNAVLRDLKLSPFGTITFLLDEEAYEISYNGAVLWKGPNNGSAGGDTTEHYHHEFTRLENGHYMVLGNEAPLSQLKKKAQKDHKGKGMYHHKIKPGYRDTFFNKTSFGTIIEYDSKGNIAWSWKSSKYFTQSDVRYFRMQNRPVFDVHENAFWFDQKNKVIYVSFRHVSRILKVKYPEGNVIRAYGEIYYPGSPQKEQGLLRCQHSCRLSENGYLYLFDNGCDLTTPPRVIRVAEPRNGKDSLKIIWEYECNADGLTGKKRKLIWGTVGGNVIELPDSSIFVCMGSDNSKVFIVSYDKKILWSAAPEGWDSVSKSWYVISQYRASIIDDRKSLERLIWNVQ